MKGGAGLRRAGTVQFTAIVTRALPTVDHAHAVAVHEAPGGYLLGNRDGAAIVEPDRDLLRDPARGDLLNGLAHHRTRNRTSGLRDATRDAGAAAGDRAPDDPAAVKAELALAALDVHLSNAGHDTELAPLQNVGLRGGHGAAGGRERAAGSENDDAGGR